MKDYRITHGSRGGLWKYLYPAFFCTACLPQLLSAATLNQNGNCTITDKNNPGYQTDCQDSNKHGGSRDTIIVAEDEVINVFASDSNKTVIAINGGHHHDTIINHGEIYLQVTNTGEIIPLWHYGDKKSPFLSKTGKKLSGAYKPTIKKPAFWLFNLDNISLDAIGIAGGHGNDIITNYGLLDVSVITTLTDEAGIAQTYSIGITGDKGNDQLVNEGQLNVTSDAVVTVDDVTFSLINSGDAQRKAMAIAKGVTGNKGKDEIINKGQLTVTANATVDTADFNITLLGGPVDVDASSEAWAGAIGLDGGEGHDHIYNEGIMTVTANALVDSDNVSIDLIDIPGGKSVRAPLSANAMAIGIVGGEGHDYIYNSGNLNVVADAKANALDVQITGLSLSTGGANTTSEAIAIGIHGGNGQDDIYNDGNITVKAKANTNTDNFNVTVFDLSFIPPLFGFEDEQVATTATSEAIGIIAGDGNDMVTNTGSLLAQSDATVDVDGLAVSLLGLGSEVNRTAMARVTGITGNHGNDYIKNIGQLDATSNAKLDLLSISVDLLGGATNIDASNQAMASAIGIDGGDGHDYIFNSGSTNVTANASVNSVDVGISLLSVLQGQDIRAPIYVDADASGILGGDGHDYIESTGSLTVTADARADALDMDFSAVDLSSGGMSTTSEASAMGIDGGKGKSEIYNGGNITIKSTATTDTESFAFTLVDLSIVSDIVDLIFDTPVDASTTAKADGTGIKTGYDHDLISNYGSLSVTVDAITNTFEMSVSADGVSNFTELSDFPDFFLKEPVVDASTTAEASVTGITSGHGHDEIYNIGTLFAKAKADVTANSIGVDLPLPDLLPQILPNIDTTEVATAAKASAMGITTGDGHDIVQNDGNVWSEAIANANSLSVNATLDVPIIPDPIDYKIPYSIEANLVDVGAQSEADAIGIETGKGHDYIYSIGNVTAKAKTNSNATNIAATVAYSDDKVSFGLSLANASTEGKATALGINSGSGDDWLHTTGNVLADSFVDTNSTAVTVDLQLQKDTIVGIGASATRANTEAETNSIGIELGEGNDDAFNEGSITAKAHNNADAVGVDVGVTIPVGDKFGIIGEGNWVTTDTIATSSADGMLGGDGRDHIFNSGTVSADAFSDPNSVGVTANASGTKKGASIGIALTQANTEGTATSNGIRGGQDRDKLVNTGTINSKAKTDVDAVSVAASLTLTDKGVALTGTAADGSTNATSTAKGMTGDEAEDVIHNEGTVDVLADADALTASVSVAASGASKGVALGLALSRATSEANANSEGISGGSHSDELYSSGLVKSHAKAKVIAGSGALAGGGTGKGLTVEGAAADGSTTGNATATGISGDQGEDHIVNKGMVDVLADVDATSVSVGVTANGTGTGVTIGIALGRATSKAEADSHGISGGSDSDSIANSGTVKSHALTTTIAGSGALAAGGSSKGVTVEGAGVDAATNANSTATGITGDEGYVHIFNEGDVDVLADADAVSVSAAVSANGTGTGVTFGLGLARATSEAEADSTGLAGGIYGDKIYSEGLVKSHATSLVVAGSIALAAGGAGKGLVIEGAGADGSTKGKSTAVGINGKQGKDHIVNKGTVDVLANADATSASVSVTANGTGTGAAIGVAVGRARSEAEADSIGINGGADSDDIYSSGMVKSHAKSIVVAGSGALSVGGTGTGLTAQLAGADAATKATSTAKGINGGEGYDHIFSENTVDVLADAFATSVSVSVSGNFSGTGVSFGLGLARASSEADANSIGISGGAYHDEIFSTALVKSRAKTNVIAGSGGAAFGGAGTGLSVQGAGADAGTHASSIARGITGDDGYDHIFSEGMVDVEADAMATSVAVSATANGAGTGVTLGIGLARATSEAEATSSGISGGADKDEIASWGNVKSHANSLVIAGAATLAGGGAGTGLTVQGAAADGLTKGLATASGITGNQGDDILQSEGELDVYAEVITASVSVSVSANGTGTGVSVGVALARAASEGEANSTGISGGDDNDIISNTNLLKAHAKSGVNAVSVSAAMGGTGTGVAIQGAAADAATVSTANATGISGDSGIDEIYNEGTLDVLADADATSVSVGLSVSGTGAGVGLGISVARAGTHANSNATGISLSAADEVIEEEDEPHHDKKHKDDKSHEYAKTGHQDDKSCNKGDKHQGGKSCNNGHEREETEYVENHGKITAKSYADANSDSISVQLGISGAGLQAGAAIVDASTMANATAQGIEGSQHKDIITNRGSINTISNAGSTTVSVGVNFNAEIKGAALSVALTDATANATANSTGIAGLIGNDEIGNSGMVSATSIANTNAISVSLPLSAAIVPLSAGIANTDVTSSANAFGLDGGDGHDYLVSSGTILADTDSDAFGISVSVAPIGVSLAYANVTADSTATGIAGASGDDVIHQTETAALTAKSQADAIGTVISATLMGVAGTIFDENKITANSQSLGISGGAGDDEITNYGSIDTEANSKATGVSVSAAFSGAAFATMTTKATTHSTGITGGENYDHIMNQGSIHTKGSSQTSGTSVSAAFEILTFADTSSTSTMFSTGIDSGEHDDYIKNAGSIHTEGSATASGTSVSVALRGAAFADTSTNATMDSTGISSGAGDDHVKNISSIHSEGSATATGTTVSAALVGAAFADTSTSATMYSTGISGGAGYDYILNLDSIIADANSTASGTTVSVALAGAAFADLFSKSTSDATGITAGADKDKVINKGTISVDANATADGTSIAAGLVGYFDGDASTEVEANARGIELGGGDDFVLSEGTIDITARSESTVTAGSGTLAGRAGAKSNITSSVDAHGITGGGGNDLIINKGSIKVGPGSETAPWMSRLNSESFTLSLLGVANAESELFSETQSTGLDGGSGDDRIFNKSELDVTASSYSSSSSSSFALAGVASAKGAIVTDALATGMNAGVGADHLVNEGGIDVDAHTFANTDASSLTIFGGANTSSGIIGTVTAIGMAGGGDEGDEIANLGWIDVLATSLATANGDSFSLIGGATSDAFITADANANGIIGSQGNDELYNKGSIEVVAASTANAGQDASVGLIGDVTAGADIVANAIARGIAVNDGNDHIQNEGDIDVSVTTTGNANSDSQTGWFEGDGDSDSNGDVNATGIGFELAADNNTLYNNGTMVVSALATMNTSATADGSNFADGNAVSDAGSSAGSFVYGVWADDGNNQINNNGDITLFSNTLTTAVTSADGDGFFGFGDGRANSDAGNGEVSPLAVGIRLGDGDHRINNNGLIAMNVTGTATANARADGDLVTSSANAAATASMAATVYGIQVGDGEQKLHNTGDILAEATVHAFAYAIANPSADPDGWGNADATTSTTVHGAGITTGSGQHEIINAGNITVRLKANPNVSVDNHDAHANGDGDARYSTADTIATATANGSGILTKSNESWIQNQGNILVDTHANVAPKTASASDWTADTKGTGKTTVTANGKGIVLSGDDNSIANAGQITVNARATATPIVNANTWGWGSNADAISENTINAIADGLLVTGNNNEITNNGEIQVSGLSNANSRVRAVATDGPDANGDVLSGSHATAITNVNGIHSIDGADWIHNFGRIDVAATSVGQMDSDALGGGIDGDARAYATGIAQASAYGIRSDQLNPGNSAILDDVIVNKADIIVSANANAFASAWAEEDAGSTSSELASGTATATARSFGIHTGNGNDTVINRGLIDVTAIATASVSVETEDNDREYRNPSASAEAVGISTGAGDDFIKNKGTITASRILNGVTSAGTVIDSGSGNDIVSLMAFSKISGDIQLGSDNDTLNIFGGSSVTGKIFGGSGTDTVVFNGKGEFSMVLTDFQKTVKQGDGTYSLTQLAPMEKISVEQGVLEINSDYEFAAGSSFMPSVSSGDGHGKLVINGAVNFSAASINIMKGRGHHLDGEKQTVLYASEGILNSMSFNNIKLPEKTPLLEFHHEITTDEVQVSTSVESFKTVASSNNQRIIANYMDGLLPNAKGDVSEALGEIQAMKAGGHASAFNSVNPEPYVNTQQAVSLGVKQYTTTLHQRTRGLRNLQQHKQFTQPGFFSFEQGDALINLDGTVGVDVIMSNRQRSLRQYGSWFKSYHQNGQLDRSATNTGFDFDMTGAAFGFDKWMHKNWVIGGSMAQNTTDLNVDGVSSNSDIKSQLFSFYTTYMTDTGYIDGSLSYGGNDYTTRRDVTVGPISDTVISEHAGNSFAASFGGGLYFPVNTWKMELFANMNYQQEDEEGFRESGAGGISLDVAARSTDSLVSETGIRFGKHLKQRYSSWFTELGLAWVHEFNNDQSVQASFVDSPGSSFTVYGQEIEDGLVFSAGLNYTNKKGFTGSAEYRAERRGAYSDQIVSGYIQYQF